MAGRRLHTRRSGTSMGMVDSLILRPEAPGDFDAIDFVNRMAFHPRTAEADLVWRLRLGGKVLLSLVAIERDRVVGHALFSTAQIRDAAGRDRPVAALGPIAVLPERQRQGIGGQLIYAGLEQLTRMDHAICILVGHPEYYPRFGFEPGSHYGIRPQWEVPDPVFMVKALQAGALENASGTAYYAPEFEGV